MKAKAISLLFGLLLAGSSLTVDAQQLAFPGAQGWGRFATGGRTGTVYHVTNLNDSGTGSLRDAVSQPNRIVVFDVSGVININSRIVFSKNLYVAGQTAPGEGITVYGDGVSFSAADDVIIRYIRFRMGKGGTSGKDAAGIANGKNMIFDHCSFSWGLDETFSINPDGKGTSPHYITISNSIMGQGLLPHSAGGLMQADSITLYRNLYCDNSTRNNKVKGTNQYVNNIVYNWSDGGYLMGGDSQGESYVNITNNLFINGPMTGASKDAITTGNADFHIYAVDNLQDKNLDGILNPVEIPRGSYGGGPTFHDTPFSYPALEAWPAAELAYRLLPEVGASLPYRDLVDFYMVHEVRSYGTEGVLISSESQLPIGIPSSWSTWSYTKPTDTDGDGMPDEWEQANGTNPAVNDAMTIAANGYANIENYINSLTADNRPLYLRAPILPKTSGVTDTSIIFSWYDFTEGEDGFLLEQEIDGSYQQIARIPAETERFTVTGLTAGTAYKFRLRAYKGSSYSDYVEFTGKTQPEYVPMVDCDTFVGDDDKNWLIAPATDEVITLDEAVDKDAVVVRTDADVTITGAGSITGKASMNKTGTGTLTLGTENSYTGATVLHNGTVNFATLRNGGETSSIGTSIEYAQNWIWDGGVWNYTGLTTTTNRCAQIYKDTEFRIANSGTTVNFGGSIEGSGDFILNGSGVLKPQTADFFSYEGATILRGGTLQLEYVDNDADKNINLGNLENVSTKLVMAGGNFVTKGANDNYLTYDFPIEVTENTYSTFTVQRNCYIKCNVSGMGTLEYKVPYVREYITGDWSGFYGTLVANGTGSDRNGSQLMFNNSTYKGMPNTSVYLKGNTRALSWVTTDELWLGGLSGDAGTYLSGASKSTATSKMTWHVGGANTDETFNGVIDNRCSANNYNGTTSIVKEGSGVWRLTGTNVYSGTTTVNGGSLVVNGNNSGTGAYTVNADATLAGTGTVAGSVTVNDGGVIKAGDTSVGNSTLTLNSSLRLNSGAVVYTPVTSSACNSITLKGFVTIGDGVTLQLAEGELDAAPYDATAYRVFNLSNATIIGTFSEIVPAVPGEGQTWDLSELYTNGIIKVVGGEANPNPVEPDEPEIPSDDVKTALISWGNTTTSSYDNSGLANMLIGVEGQPSEGFSMVLTGNLAKTYTAASKINVEYGDETLSLTTIKTSNGAENTIFLPANAKATKITLWSYTNLDAPNRPNYWASVGGVDYTEETATILTSYKNLAGPDRVSFDLPDLEDVVTFRNTGEQQCVVVYLEYHYGDNPDTGISNAVGSAAPVRVEYYTVSGKRVSAPVKGLYIMKATTADGKVVTRKVVL